MNRSRVRSLLVGMALLVSACSDAAPTAAEEVAGELRALRLMLAQQARSTRDPLPTPPTTTERLDVQAALAPLRSVLDAMAASQQELANRQIALTQELQRWSQLLVESVAGARAEEAKAMTAKLRELEASLQGQDARHREVETLIQGALERTADKLDEFLRRLPGGTAPGGPPAPANGSGAAPAAPTGSPAPAGGAIPGGERTKAEPSKAEQTNAGQEHTEHPSTGAKDPDESTTTRPLAARTSGGSMRWWWLGLTCLGAAVATFFLRRSRRSASPERFTTQPQPQTSMPLAAPREQSVDEIWAAAALLGEAIGRLRHNGAPNRAVVDHSFADVDQDRVETQQPEPPADEFVVTSLDETNLDDTTLDESGFDQTEPDASTATPELAPSTAPVLPEAARSEPREARAPRPLDTMLARVPGRTSERQVLAMLAEEPLVLRRPAPTFRELEGTLEVSFHVLPGMSPGERARLMQRLRDTVRGVG